MTTSAAFSDQMGELANRIDRELTDVSDYIWKSPRLLEHETKLELSKLPVYFPNDPNTAKLRWRLESHKLESLFPYLIAVGNLFSVVSIFESYLLLLSGKLQEHTSVAISSSKGQGVARLFNYLRSLDIVAGKLPLYEQIQAAIKIRNCLAHASGMLPWSRDEKELRRLTVSGTYLTKEHRDMRHAQGGVYDEVVVSESPLGDRLQVTNEYSHIVAYYTRKYLIDLCGTASQKCGQAQSK